MNDDSALLRQFVENRSNEAFAELVRRHVNLVYSTALRETRGDIHRAEEATQLVFIDLGRKAPSLVNRTVLAGWLYLGVAFAVARLARSERRWRRREQEANAMYEMNAGAFARDADWNQLRPVLDAVMHEMGQRDREAVLLRFFEGRSFSQIGERLSLTEDTARKRVDRALGKLQNLLERRGIKSTTSALAGVLAAEAVTAAPPGLAGAATGAALMGGSGTMGVFAFMSTTKLIVGIVGAAALTGAVGHALNNRARLEESGTIAALRKSLAESAVAEKSDQARIAQLQQWLTAMTAQAQARHNDLPAANTKAVSGNTVSMEDLVKEHPELRAVVNRIQRRNIILIYGSALTSLGLPTDKLTQLESLLADLRFSQGDAREAALAAGLQPGTPGFGDAIRQAQDADRQQILALIGNQGWAQLQQAQFTNGYQTQVNSSYAPGFQASGVPLNNNQSQALAQAMDDVLNPNVNAAARDPSFSVVDPQTGLSPSDQDLIGRASRVLSAGQAAVLKQEISDGNQLHAVVGSARVISH